MNLRCDGEVGEVRKARFANKYSPRRREERGRVAEWRVDERVLFLPPKKEQAGWQGSLSLARPRKIIT